MFQTVKAGGRNVHRLRLVLEDVPDELSPAKVRAALEAAGYGAVFADGGVPWGNHRALRSDRWPATIAGGGPVDEGTRPWAEIVELKPRRITLDVDPADHATVTLAARNAGEPLQRWAVRVMLEAARVVVVLALVAAVISSTSPAAADELEAWPCTVPVFVDDGPHRSAALGALQQLDDATVIDWQLVDEPAAPVKVVWADLEIPGVARGIVGQFVTVTLDVDVPARWFGRTILHELGHVAGLQHVDEGPSVMADVDRVPHRRYTAADLERLAALTCREA